VKSFLAWRVLFCVLALTSLAGSLALTVHLFSSSPSASTVSTLVGAEVLAKSSSAVVVLPAGASAPVALVEEAAQDLEVGTPTELSVAPSAETWAWGGLEYHVEPFEVVASASSWLVTSTLLSALAVLALCLSTASGTLLLVLRSPEAFEFARPRVFWGGLRSPKALTNYNSSHPSAPGAALFMLPLLLTTLLCGRVVIASQADGFAVLTLLLTFVALGFAAYWAKSELECRGFGFLATHPRAFTLEALGGGGSDSFLRLPAASQEWLVRQDVDLDTLKALSEGFSGTFDELLSAAEELGPNHTSTSAQASARR
jgi:hypothetical protein